jgi:hypothetical protein
MRNESAIPAVHDALLGWLEGHTDGALLAEGKPEPVPDELVALWEVDQEADFASLGQRKLKEVINFLIFVEAIVASGEDFAPARQRAEEIASAVEARFREDLSLGGAWQFGRISKRKRRYFRADKARGCRVELTLTGQAKI